MERVALGLLVRVSVGETLRVGETLPTLVLVVVVLALKV
jgi:hypothetical protein